MATDWGKVADNAGDKVDAELAAGLDRLCKKDLTGLFPVPADKAKVEDLTKAITASSSYNERAAAFKAVAATLGSDALKMLKGAMLALLVCMAFSPAARAGSFALLNPAALQTSAGTFISMDGTGSAVGLTAAAITYKAPVSNNVLSAFVSGWVPLTLGGTVGAGLGGPSVAIGSGLSLLPAARAGLLAAIGALSKPGALASLQGALQSQDSPVALFVGPQYNLVFTSPSRCFGKPTWFIGASVTWR